MTQEKLNEVIASHGRWLDDKTKGERANLSRTKFSAAAGTPIRAGHWQSSRNA